jgi:hypothetical protein
MPTAPNKLFIPPMEAESTRHIPEGRLTGASCLLDERISFINFRVKGF